VGIRVFLALVRVSLVRVQFPLVVVLFSFVVLQFEQHFTLIVLFIEFLVFRPAANVQNLLLWTRVCTWCSDGDFRKHLAWGHC